LMRIGYMTLENHYVMISIYRRSYWKSQIPVLELTSYEAI